MTFSSCSKTQCVAFVSNTFSCVLLLCINCNFKPSGNHANQYPTWNSWTHCLVVWSWAVSEGDIEEHGSVTRWHLQKVLCSGDRMNYPKATWALVEEDHNKGRLCPYPNHEEKQVSLIVDNQGRADQAKWMSCFCPHGPKAFGSSCVSHKTSSQMSQTDAWSSPPTLRIVEFQLFF